MSRQKIYMILVTTLLLAAIPFGRTEGLGKIGNKAIIENPDEMATGSISEVRILHIGDSHIQADFFTGEVRRLLRQYLRDTLPQRGFIFPFAVAGSNNPTDFKSTSTGSWQTLKSTNSPVTESLGVNGLALSTSDAKATITIKIKSENSRFNRVRVFYSTKGGFKPSVVGNFTVTKTTEESPHEITFNLSRKSDSLTLKVLSNEEDGELLLHGIILEDTCSKFSYNVAGLNGASTTSFTRCKMLQSEVESINPTVVIISLGTNDAYIPSFSPTELKNNLDALIASIHHSAPSALIVLTTPGDFLAKGHRRTTRPQMAAEVIVQVANKHHLPVWNFFEAMGGKGSINAWRGKGLAAPDGLHLSKEGYKVQGQMFFEWLTGLNT